MKYALTAVCTLILAAAAFAQTPAPSAFSTTSISFNLTPITLPGSSKGTLSGAETDIMFPLTTNNIFGETTLIGESTFIGGRYERVIPSVAKYLQNHTALTGGNFQFALTSSLGVVRGVTNSWGGRTGFSLKYAPAGSTSFNIGFEAQANYLPNYAGLGTQHWIPSVALGPNFRW
jgi:hypothetical protein